MPQKFGDHRNSQHILQQHSQNWTKGHSQKNNWPLCMILFSKNSITQNSAPRYFESIGTYIVFYRGNVFELLKFFNMVIYLNGIRNQKCQSEKQIKREGQNAHLVRRNEWQSYSPLSPGTKLKLIIEAQEGEIILA